MIQRSENIFKHALRCFQFVAMNSFMLRKCLECLQTDNTDDINVQVSCACCGSIVKEANIEHNDDEEKQGGKVEGDILQPESSRITRFRSCFSLRRKSISETNKRVAEKAVHIHTPSSSTKDLSKS